MSLNFTVGPVQTYEDILKIGGEQVPYFRTEEFSEMMRENEKMILSSVHAPNGSKAIFLTGSGTAAMEASIVNLFTDKDKLIIVNGGSFGERFTEICSLYKIPYNEILVPFGKNITNELLEEAIDDKCTGFLINVDETSSGTRYDMELVCNFCKKYKLILVADIISSFLADDNNMLRTGAQVYIIGSQKALACQPGISILILDPLSVERIMNNCSRCYYLDLKKALINSERGQTPFTPAVGILRQINKRLKNIIDMGGFEKEVSRVHDVAVEFREGIKDLPLKIVSDSPSNAVTALYIEKKSANELFLDIKKKYDIWICPNGGKYKDTVFRIGHIGNITSEDNKRLIDILHEELR